MNTLRTTSFGFVLAVALTGCGAAPGEEWTDGSGDVTSSDSNSVTSENGMLNLNGLSNINGLTNINGITNLNGVTNINGVLNMNGLSNINGLTNLNGVMNLNGITNLNGIVNYNGIQNINGVANWNGVMNYNGITNLNGISNLNGVMNFNGLVSIDGLQRMNSTNTNFNILPNGGEMMNSVSGRDLAKYMIQCALSSSQSIQRRDSAGTLYTFTGKIGVATTWLSTSQAACGLDCEEKVSACLMAHMNPSGNHQQIMLGGGGPGSNNGTLLGDNDSCPTGACGSGDSYYNEKEGAFWGNLFIRTQPQAHYCQSDFNSLSDTRTCADHTGDSPCPFTPTADECEDTDSAATGYTFLNSATKYTRPAQNLDEKYAFTAGVSTRFGADGHSSSQTHTWTQLPKNCPATVTHSNTCTHSTSQSVTYSHGQTMCTGGSCGSYSGCTVTCNVCDTWDSYTITNGTQQCVSVWKNPITTWYHH